MAPIGAGAASALERLPAAWRFGDIIGDRLRANEAQWLLVAPAANPAMLQMFRDRDRQPVRDLVPWAGEFAGKYLTSAVQCYRLTQSPALRAHTAEFVRALIATQSEDGYLGAFPRAYRLTGHTVKPDGSDSRTWDAWNHYHCMLGLLLWSQETGDPDALRACQLAADLICHTFLDTDRRLVDTGSEEMNLAPIHVLCLLYRHTGEARYLRMARAIERDFEAPTAGDYLRTALAGLDFYQTPKPRWESLHPIQGLAELYLLTGDPRYRQACEHIWRSIRRYDRHNTGGFSSGEQATGNPYDPAAIETCCTVAWMALSGDLLRLTGDSAIADELELSTFNALLGAQSPTGRWWTYNTPMAGARRASAHDIVFQARAGSPELNCCSVNGPRGLGLLSEWALMRTAAGEPTLNYYGPCELETRLPSGARLRLHQETAYPVAGDVTLRVLPDRAERFCLRLRVPAWSTRTEVAINGVGLDAVRPGAYLPIDRVWAPDDVVTLKLDLSLRLWRGEREAAGRASVYRGPILLTYDQRLNALDPHELPALAADALAGTRIQPPGSPAPMVALAFPTTAGELVLCDFASAGVAGNPYETWLPLAGDPAC